MTLTNQQKQDRQFNKAADSYNLDAKAAINIGSKMAVRFDQATATVAYIGEAEPGTVTSADAWSIKKLDTTTYTIITWADGNANYDNVWDNRASLTYS